MRVRRGVSWMTAALETLDMCVGLKPETNGTSLVANSKRCTCCACWNARKPTKKTTRVRSFVRSTNTAWVPSSTATRCWQWRGPRPPQRKTNACCGVARAEFQNGGRKCDYTGYQVRLKGVSTHISRQRWLSCQLGKTGPTHRCPVLGAKLNSCARPEHYRF